MDSAVALVQAYLYANGYFTLTEYPVIEALRRDQYRTSTDIDLLAVRFPGAGRLLARSSGKRSREEIITKVDPALDPPDDCMDVLIVEVKEGKATLNRGGRDRSVLSTALTRIGVFDHDDEQGIIDRLLDTGTARTAEGPQVRLVAFGSTHDPKHERPYTVITLGHSLGFLLDYADEYWDALRTAQMKDPALGFLLVLMKAIRQDPALRKKLAD